MGSKIGSKKTARGTSNVVPAPSETREKRKFDPFWPAMAAIFAVIMSGSVYAGNYVGHYIGSLKASGKGAGKGEASRLERDSGNGKGESEAFHYEPPEMPSLSPAGKAEATVKVGEVNVRPFDADLYAKSRPAETSEEGAGAMDEGLIEGENDEPPLGIRNPTPLGEDDLELIQELSTEPAPPRNEGLVPMAGEERKTAPADQGSSEKTGGRWESPVKSSAVFRVQLGVFSDKDKALDLLNELKAKHNQPFYLDAIPSESETFYRVQMGTFATREEADAAAVRLISDGHNAFIVTISK